MGSWKQFRDTGHLSTHSVTYEFGPEGKLLLSNSCSTDDIELRIEFALGAERPRIYISVEGISAIAPIFLSWVRKAENGAAPGKDSVVSHLLHDIGKELRIIFRIQAPGKGAPKKPVVARAAWFHGYEGKSLRETAKALGELTTGDEKERAKDRISKRSGIYFASLRKTLRKSNAAIVRV
jgi:hypothetical protein